MRSLKISSVPLIITITIFLFWNGLVSVNAMVCSKETTAARRSAIQRILSGGGTCMLTLATVFNPDEVNALEACRSKARNCIRTTWFSPENMTKDGAVEIIRNVLNSYPQNGQAGVDCNGWQLVKDSLDNMSPSRSEYIFKSCVGPAALAINLGQPFIDDVKLEVQESNGRVLVEVKSSSRMGSTDMFVNKKRIDFLGDELRRKGWEVPSIQYGL